MSSPRLIVYGPLPPPFTGQSTAVQEICIAFGEYANVKVINTSKSEFASGLTSLHRLSAVIRSLFEYLLELKSAEIIYFNCSQSMAGGARDLICYGLSWSKLSRMTVHLHGGAGMRVLLSNKHPIIRSLNRFFLKRVGAVVVLGERLMSIYDDFVPADRLYAVHNFAGDEFFVDDATIKGKFADLRTIRLLFLSNFLPGKGHQELLAALALLPDDVKKSLHVDFAGGYASTAEEASFMRAVDQTKGVSISVHGVVQGQLKKDLLSNAHLFCLPTYYPYEGQPISILEAYASGCAVMTTDHSGIFDTFTPGVNGIEVQPKSPQDIANAIIWARKHSQELEGFALKNHCDAQSKYRASIHLDALRKIILRR